jgi:hypothetical protein
MGHVLSGEGHRDEGRPAGPGATALTRMPFSISSSASAFVKVTIAPFVAA